MYPLILFWPANNEILSRLHWEKKKINLSQLIPSMRTQTEVDMSDDWNNIRLKICQHPSEEVNLTGWLIILLLLPMIKRGLSQGVQDELINVMAKSFRDFQRKTGPTPNSLMDWNTSVNQMDGNYIRVTLSQNFSYRY